jgi:hypothetical protein
MSRIALDSNILIYNHSLTCENKMLIAINFFNENPIVSSQVISEYLNVMRKKFKMEKNELIQLCSLWLEKCTVQPVILSTVRLAQNLIGKYNFQLLTNGARPRPCLHGHGRASEEPKGLIPRSSAAESCRRQRVQGSALRY